MLEGLQGCDVYEVDQQEVTHLKERLIKESGIHPKARARKLERIGTNFEGLAMKPYDWLQKLVASVVERMGKNLEEETTPFWMRTLFSRGFDRTKPAVWVMEGLLYYLTVLLCLTLV